jgi:hypothetical protein
MNAIARTARFVDVARADFGRVYSYTASLSGEPRLAHTRALLSRIVVRRLFFLLDAMSKRGRAGEVEHLESLMIELASRPAKARNRRSRSYGKGGGTIMIPMDSLSSLENFTSPRSG